MTENPEDPPLTDPRKLAKFEELGDDLWMEILSNDAHQLVKLRLKYVDKTPDSPIVVTPADVQDAADLAWEWLQKQCEAGVYSSAEAEAQMRSVCAMAEILKDQVRETL